MSLETNHELLLAAGDGDLEEVRIMLETHGVNEHDEHGNTALFHAVWENQLHVVKFLLTKMTKLDAQVQNNDLNTPLHFAVARGKSHVAVIETLMEFGCDIEVKNAGGESAQDLVAKSAEFSTHRQIRALFHLSGGSKNVSSMLQSLRRGGAAARSQANASGKPGDADADDVNVFRLQDAEDLFELLLNRAPGDASTTSINYLTPRHISAVFQFLGMKLSTVELKEVLKLMDVNGDSHVDVHDLHRWLSPKIDPLTMDRHWTIDKPFAALDADGDGYLGADDYRNAAEQLGAMFCCVADTHETNSILQFTELVRGKKLGASAETSDGGRPNSRERGSGSGRRSKSGGSGTHVGVSPTASSSRRAHMLNLVNGSDTTKGKPDSMTRGRRRSMVELELPEFNMRTLAKQLSAPPGGPQSTRSPRAPSLRSPLSPVPAHKSGTKPTQRGVSDRTRGRRGSACAMDWVDASKKVMGTDGDGPIDRILNGGDRIDGSPKSTTRRLPTGRQRSRASSVFAKGKRGGGALSPQQLAAAASPQAELRGLDKEMFERLCLGTLDVAGAVRQTEAQRGPTNV